MSLLERLKKDLPLPTLNLTLLLIHRPKMQLDLPHIRKDRNGLVHTLILVMVIPNKFPWGNVLSVNQKPLSTDVDDRVAEGAKGNEGMNLFEEFWNFEGGCWCG